MTRSKRTASHRSAQSEGKSCAAPMRATVRRVCRQGGPSTVGSVPVGSSARSLVGGFSVLPRPIKANIVAASCTPSQMGAIFSPFRLPIVSGRRQARQRRISRRYGTIRGRESHAVPPRPGLRKVRVAVGSAVGARSGASARKRRERRSLLHPVPSDDETEASS